MSERLKILISAYACSPYKGSEPGVGWGFVAALAKRHELWVIVEEEKYRADIEHYLGANPEFSRWVHFFFVKKARNRRLRKIWPPSYYWYYRRWHQEALDLAQALHGRVGFDLVHQLTMVGFREPGYLWKMRIPFVWGPVGGMGVFPWRFLPVVGGYGALYYTGYNLFNTWQMRFALRPRKAARSAGVGLITATPENQLGAQEYWGCSSSMICEVGLPPVPAQRPTARKSNEPLRVAWAGLHLPRKALNLALHSLARLPKAITWELHVLGQGERTRYWQQLAQQLGVAEHCHFAGWLPREEAIHLMASSHLMLITSLRDLTSTVTIEALALGLPIVCLDHCGFAGVVNDRCGIKVQVTTPEKVVVGLAEGIARLANNEELRMQLAEGALLRAQDFSWDNKAAAVDEIYRRKLAEYEAIEA